MKKTLSIIPDSKTTKASMTWVAGAGMNRCPLLFIVTLTDSAHGCSQVALMTEYWCLRSGLIEDLGAHHERPTMVSTLFSSELVVPLVVAMTLHLLAYATKVVTGSMPLVDVALVPCPLTAQSRSSATF